MSGNQCTENYRPRFLNCVRRFDSSREHQEGTREREVRSMDKVTSNDGTAIAFDRLGAGPAVILVGGAFQHRAIDQQTARLAELLGPAFTVFHYDRRGRG